MMQGTNTLQRTANYDANDLLLEKQKEKDERVIQSPLQDNNVDIDTTDVTHDKSWIPDNLIKGMKYLP